MYENGSIQRSNIRTYGVVLKSAEKNHLRSSNIIFFTNNTVGVKSMKMVALNTETSGRINLRLSQINQLICDIHELYPLPLILLGVECTKMEAFNALTSRPMDFFLNQLKNSFVILMHNIPYQ